MSMSNPVFSDKSVFVKGADRTPAGYPTMPGYEIKSGNTVANDAMRSRFENVSAAYYKPSADAVATGRMTYDDVLVKTGVMFAFLLVAAAISWYAVFNLPNAEYIIGGSALIALVLGLVNAFKTEPSPLLIIAYAVFEGAVLGGISGLFEFQMPGVVSTALIATLVTFAVCLALFKTRLVRVNSMFMKVLTIGAISYLVFSLVSFGLSSFGIIPGGLRSITVLGMPLGLIVGVVAVLLASMSLISDFHFIQQGVEAGIPAKYAWTAAFGLVVTLVWLYVEFLRIASYFYSRD